MGNKINILYSWCKLNVKDGDNILWGCNKAFNTWKSVILCWSLDCRQVQKLEPPFWNAYKIFNSNKINSIWKITVCAILWTLWLSRNECLFHQKKDSTGTLEELIKYRSFQWGVTENLLRNDLEELWRVNPIGTSLLSIKKEAEEGIILWNTDVV